MKQVIIMLSVYTVVCLGVPRLLAQTNLVGNLNPGFESGLTGWGGSGFANVSLDTVNAGQGGQSAKHSASPGNTWNTLVNTAMIPVTTGKIYQLSVSTRRTLVGGTASFGLNELNSSQISTAYLWKATSSGTSWHSESLTLTPRSDTRYIRIYLIVDTNATSGAAWWDNCRLVELDPNGLTAATTNPFSDPSDLSNLVLDIAPLPVSTFTRNGTSISPPSLVPSVKIGTLLVGGTLSWKVVTAASGPSGTAILQDSTVVSATGLFAWTLDLDASVSSLPAGNYLLVINANSRDQTITRTSSRPFTIQ